MKSLIAILVVFILFAGCYSFDAHPDSSSWEDVFAKDLSNAEGDVRDWSWSHSGDLVPHGPGTLLSQRNYTNFIVDVAYVMDPTANSGLFLYDTDHPKYKFEVQILDDNDPMYVTELPYQNTGAIYGRLSPTRIASRPAGELNRMTCRCEGSKITVILNGEKVVDTDISAWKDPLVNPDGSRIPKWHKGFPALSKIPMHGRIGLQGVHGGKAVHYKYVRVKSL